ncbi:MAG TPA: hypothetical protein VHS26_03545 [Solirubrobacteraceae bacterium]|nr:hypothetical protein [Solirubrobacteraceae bacterium]
MTIRVIVCTIAGSLDGAWVRAGPECLWPRVVVAPSEELGASSGVVGASSARPATPVVAAWRAALRLRGLRAARDACDPGTAAAAAGGAAGATIGAATRPVGAGGVTDAATAVAAGSAVAGVGCVCLPDVPPSVDPVGSVCFEPSGSLCFLPPVVLPPGFPMPFLVLRASDSTAWTAEAAVLTAAAAGVVAKLVGLGALTWPRACAADAAPLAPRDAPAASVEADGAAAGGFS